MTVDGAWESVLPVRGSEPDWSPDGNSLLFPGRVGFTPLQPFCSLPVREGLTPRRPVSGRRFSSRAASWSQETSCIDRAGHQVEKTSSSCASTPQSSPTSMSREPMDPTRARLVAGDDPRWSPDGLTISFDLPQGVVATVNVDSSNLRTRAADGSSSQVNNGDWSPDGRRLVFSQIAAPSVTRIFIFDIDRGAMAELIPDAIHAASANYVDFEAAWLRPTNSPWDY